MTAQDLKNSILQLAIQGKLVEQKSEEGTAKTLIDTIKLEKMKLIKEGKIPKEKKLEEIKDIEMEFNIPENWRYVRVQDIASYITDYVANGSFATLKKNTNTYKEKNYAIFVRTMDLTADFQGECTYIDESSYIFLEKSKLYGGELILPNIGGSIGKAFIMPDLHMPMSLAPNSIMIKFLYPIMNQYFSYLIQSPYGYSLLGKTKGGTATPKFSKTDLRNMAIPIPPLGEIKRIVSKIEELMIYVEQYDKTFSKLELFNKKFPEDMQKSILQYAIQGKLVDQRSEEGTAEELYQQIQAEKAMLIKEGKIKKEKPLAEITEEEIPFEIPESWKWVKLGDVFQVNPRNSIEDKIEVSFIPMTLLQEGYVSKFTFEIKKWGDVKKGFTHFKDNDIIFAKITPCFQNLKSAIMENLQNGYGAGTTELHVLRCYKMLSLEYFLWFVKSPYFMSFCEANMSGTAGQQRVGTDIVKNVLLPLPPLEEQKRIVNSIEEFIPYCHHLIK